ncbi:glutaredoxin 3 [Pseudomonas poae]|uniref:Glutaredoxin n=1 Tax=Pseudomonas poae TaxID=200451 RepID=A0A2S9ELQ5_9PSED|nr:glutaredoxin 3 [Pseudomonas poae]PRA30333.1 glutaredoxin 3 [Pseudomonas poae]PRC16289.1 glutaredoxin 3 [Pseudomonas poae]
MSQVVIYTTQFCPYCVRAKALLAKKGVAFDEVKIDGNRQLRDEMIQKAGRTSVPQIWIGAKHIGGCDELYALDYAGKLDALLLV